MSQSQPLFQGQPAPVQGQVYPPGQQPQFVQQAPPGTVAYPPGQPQQFVQQAPPGTVAYPPGQPQQYVQQAPPGTVVYPPGQQQQFVQQVPPGAVAYYPGTQVAGAVPQVMMGGVQQSVPVYDYTPSSFKTLSVVVLVLLGLFSPLTLAFTIPAVFFANKSESASKIGNITVARSQGMTAAYLIFVAVVLGLVLAIVISSVVLGVYGPKYAVNQCIAKIKERNGFIPTSSFGSSEYLYC